MTEPVGRPDAEKIAVLTTLYPIFKREVYERREAMMRTAAVGSLVLLGLLFLAPLMAPRAGALKGLAVAGLIIFSAGLIHHIREQKKRHAQAKAGLVRIEEALGLFTSGAYVQDKTLYPGSWQETLNKDWVVNVAVFNIVSLTALLVLALFLI